MLPLAVLLYAAGVAAVGMATAAPLEKEACNALKTEQTSLTAAGLRADMARGAAWAKSQLGADRLKRITRLIEVDEQILFRCPSPPDVEAAAKPLPAPKAKPKAAAAKQTPPESGGVLAPQAASAVSNAPEKPKKVSKAAAAAGKKRAAAKARSATKADDAFVPPPDAPISTLQAPAAAQPKAQ